MSRSARVIAFPVERAKVPPLKNQLSRINALEARLAATQAAWEKAWSDPVRIMARLQELVENYRERAPQE